MGGRGRRVPTRGGGEGSIPGSCRQSTAPSAGGPGSSHPSGPTPRGLGSTRGCPWVPVCQHSCQAGSTTPSPAPRLCPGPCNPDPAGNKPTGNRSGSGAAACWFYWARSCGPLAGSSVRLSCPHSPQPRLPGFRAWLSPGPPRCPWHRTGGYRDPEGYRDPVTHPHSPSCPLYLGSPGQRAVRRAASALWQRLAGAPPSILGVTELD